MSVWFAIPSKKPRAQAQLCIDRWRAQGYRVAIWRDTGDEAVDCDLLLIGEYGGYANAVNSLCKGILETYPATAWVVTGGDDTEPDMTKLADQIADECTAHFGGTFGMMQPTGDRWETLSDRISIAWQAAPGWVPSTVAACTPEMARSSGATGICTLTRKPRRWPRCSACFGSAAISLTCIGTGRERVWQSRNISREPIGNFQSRRDCSSGGRR